MEVVMLRFQIGEFVELNGLLGELHSEGRARILAATPNKDGITALDEYVIVFDDSTQLQVWSFQLTRASKDADSKKPVKRISRDHVTPHRAWGYFHVHGELSPVERDHVLQCESCLRLFQLCLKSPNFAQVLKQFSRSGGRRAAKEVPTVRLKSIFN
jgi:hypothetical protein